MFLITAIIATVFVVVVVVVVWFFWAPMLAVSQRSSASAQSVSRGDGMGFTHCSLVSTIMLSVCYSLFLFFFVFFKFFLICRFLCVALIPPRFHISVFFCIIYVIFVGVSPSVIISLHFFFFFLIGLMALHDVNV